MSHVHRAPPMLALALRRWPRRSSSLSWPGRKGGPPSSSSLGATFSDVRVRGWKSNGLGSQHLLLVLYASLQGSNSGPLHPLPAFHGLTSKSVAGSPAVHTTADGVSTKCYIPLLFVQSLSSCRLCIPLFIQLFAAVTYFLERRIYLSCKLLSSLKNYTAGPQGAASRLFLSICHHWAEGDGMEERPAQQDGAGHGVLSMQRNSVTPSLLGSGRDGPSERSQHTWAAQLCICNFFLDTRPFR